MMLSYQLPTRRGRLAAIATAGALAVSLAACSSPSSDAGATSGGSTTSDSAKPTTVSFLSWENEETMRPIIDAFEAAHPNITVEFSWAPPVAEYIQTLQTRLSAGTAADVFIITAENRTDLMDSGLVTDLSDQPFMSNIADAAKVPYTQDGKVYGMAISSWGGGILYNEDLLSQEGFTGPVQSWAEFMDLCQKLKDAGIAPFLEAIDSVPVTLDALVGGVNASMGGTMDAAIFSGASSFADTWTAPLTLFQELVDKGYLDRSAAALSGDQVMQEFEAGRVAMISTGSWTPGGIHTAAPDLRFKFMAVPGATTGDTYWVCAVSPGLAINAKTTHLDAALTFLDFIQSKTAVEMYNKETGSITTTKDFTPVVDASLSDLADGVRAGDFYLPMSSWERDQDALLTEATALIQQLVQGSISAADVAAGMDKKLASLG